MYWLVSLPHGGRAEHAWSRLQEATTYANDYSTNFKFALPESFRVGTLDSLLALSDDLAKVNAAVEGTVNKVRRQLVELQSSVAPEDRADVWVEGSTPEGYLQRFAWNEAKYPSRRPLKEIVASIMDTVQKLDDDLKVGRGGLVGGGAGGRPAGRGHVRCCANCVVGAISRVRTLTRVVAFACAGHSVIASASCTFHRNAWLLRAAPMCTLPTAAAPLLPRAPVCS